MCDTVIQQKIAVVDISCNKVIKMFQPIKRKTWVILLFRLFWQSKSRLSSTFCWLYRASNICWRTQMGMSQHRNEWRWSEKMFPSSQMFIYQFVKPWFSNDEGTEDYLNSFAYQTSSRQQFGLSTSSLKTSFRGSGLSNPWLFINYYNLPMSSFFE